MQFLTVLLVSLLMSAASLRDYVYIGVAGDIAVFEYKHKAIMVRVGGYIPNTDIIVYGTDNNGAVTSIGTILLQSRVEEIESYASQTEWVAGDCFNLFPLGKIRITSVSSFTYNVLYFEDGTKGEKFLRNTRIAKNAINKHTQLIECPGDL